RPLHVVVATEDVGAATGHADIAQRQLQAAEGAHHGVANGVLGLAHAPDDGAGPVLGHGLGNLVDLGFGHAAGLFDLLRRPGHDLGTHLVHAVDAVVEVLLVLPAVLEDVVENAPDQRNVAARTETHVLIGTRGGAREARVGDDHLGAVLLGVQDVHHGDRVGLRRVRAHEQHGLRVLHVVVGVGHGAVTPGVRHARHGGGMADARLVVAVVGAEEGHELA